MPKYSIQYRLESTKRRAGFSGVITVKASTKKDARKHFRKNVSSGRVPGVKILKITKKEKECFVATAVYKNYEHPDVKELRKYRDDILLKTKEGKIFIKIYNILGPKMAFLVRFEPFRTLVEYVIGAFIEKWLRRK